MAFFSGYSRILSIAFFLSIGIPVYGADADPVPAGKRYKQALRNLKEGGATLIIVADSRKVALVSAATMQIKSKRVKALGWWLGDTGFQTSSLLKICFKPNKNESIVPLLNKKEITTINCHKVKISPLSPRRR